MLQHLLYMCRQLNASLMCTVTVISNELANPENVQSVVFVLELFTSSFSARKCFHSLSSRSMYA